MYSALFRKSLNDFDWQRISMNLALPFSYIYLIRFFMSSYWLSSSTCAISSSSSFLLISSSLAVIFFFVVSISSNTDSNCSRSFFFSATASFFFDCNTCAFFLAALIFDACACPVMLKHRTHTNNRLRILFLFFICVSLINYTLVLSEEPVTDSFFRTLK